MSRLIARIIHRSLHYKLIIHAALAEINYRAILRFYSGNNQSLNIGITRFILHITAVTSVN
jgi:hypothetical protein